MTVGRAKAIISSIWFVFGTLIFAIVGYQTIIGKFRFAPGEWDAGAAWAIPLVLPVLAFIVPTWTLSGRREDHVVLQNSYVFFLAVFLSLVYFLALLVVLWRLPLQIDEIEHYVNQDMRSSSWILGAFQALIVAVLGKFFLEHIYDEASEGEPSRRRRRSKKTGA